MIEVREVNSLRELKAFVRFPLELYKNNNYFVPPCLQDEITTLRKDKNPVFESCTARYWLAYKYNKIVGRIAGIINFMSNQIWKQKYIRFGWLDFIDDIEVSKALFQAVEDWAKQQELSYIHGPLGFCDLDKEGMLVEGFEELSMMHSYYNYPYYPGHLENLGFAKEADWIEFQITNLSYPHELKMMSLIVQRKLSDFRVLKIKNKNDILMYKKGIINVINASYKNLHSVIPINEKIFFHYFPNLFFFLTKLDFISIVLDSEDTVAGFGIAVPLLSKVLRQTKGRLFPFGIFKIIKAFKRNDSATLLLIGVKPELQAKGIPLLIIDHIITSFLKNGIKTVEVSHMLESNTNVQRLWKHFNPRQHKRRRSYIKKLN